MTTDIITTTIGERFVALILPVTITIYCVVWVINNITYLFSEQPTAQKSLRRWQGVDTVESVIVGGAVASTIVTVVILVTVVAVATLLITLLFKYNLNWILFSWLALSLASIFLLQAWVLLDLICTNYQIPRDMITFNVFIVNIAVVVILSLFYLVHPVISQAFCIFVAILVAWTLSMMTTWIIWAILLAMTVYDIFAVLPKHGPLQLLLEQANKKNKPLPGFVYDTNTELNLFFHHNNKTISKKHESVVVEIIESREVREQNLKNNGSEANTFAHEQNEYAFDQEELEVKHYLPSSRSNNSSYEKINKYEMIHAFKLGLGDFIFYAVLVGHASSMGVIFILLCHVSILVGMIMTFTLLLNKKTEFRALPALPIPVLLSLTMLLICKFFVSSYIYTISTYNLSV